MKKYILTSLIAACTLLYLPVLAQQARQLTWGDLVPAHLLAGDPLEKLSPDQTDGLLGHQHASNSSEKGTSD